MKSTNDIHLPCLCEEGAPFATDEAVPSCDSGDHFVAGAPRGDGRGGHAGQSGASGHGILAMTDSATALHPIHNLVDTLPPSVYNTPNPALCAGAFPSIVAKLIQAGGVVFPPLGSSILVGPAFTGGAQFDEDLTATTSAAGYHNPAPGGVWHAVLRLLSGRLWLYRGPR